MIYLKTILTIVITTIFGTCIAYADSSDSLVQELTKQGTAGPILVICQNMVNARTQQAYALNPNEAISQIEKTQLLNACIAGQNTQNTTKLLQVNTVEPIMTKAQIKKIEAQKKQTNTHVINNIY